MVILVVDQILILVTGMLQFAIGEAQDAKSYSGSGGTNNSTSSGGHNDNSSSSARFSSTSTLPSSTDVPLDENYTHSNGHYDISPPPIPESNSLVSRTAGRTFSFGRRKVGSPPSVPEAGSPTVAEYAGSGEYKSLNRPRAMTESSYASGSTATPPKLLDTGLDFGQSDLDGFGSMFESFGKRQSKQIEESTTLAGTKSESPVSRKEVVLLSAFS